MMTPKRRLDLKGIISPLDLLKCKALLNTMETGDLLEVILRDQDAADRLTNLIQRSEDQLHYLKKRKKNICICIKKGRG